MSLARALSKLGVASRSEAARRIVAGEVTVDGRIVRDPDRPVVPEAARIVVSGRAARPQAPLTILLHKPRGVVTTRSDPQGRPTVYSLIEDVDRYVSPVGRLDFASSGLLLLTNDTRFANWVLDPANAVPRVYIVTVRGELTDEEGDRVIEGIQMDRALPPSLKLRRTRLRATSIEILKRSRRETHVRATLREGKNRELRRLFGAVGHEVTRLIRVSFGGLELGDLAPGRWREVSSEELRSAFPQAFLGPRRRMYREGSCSAKA